MGGSWFSVREGVDVGSRWARALFGIVATACGAAAAFVVTTVGVEQVPAAGLIGVGCIVAFGTAAVSFGMSAYRAARSTPRATLVMAAVGGALCLWAAPLVALMQRASDTPSGADTLFLTTTVWGLLCVVSSLAVRTERQAPTALAAAVAAAAGCAGLLASWENPSSFSPFAKFPAREALMVAAGVAFVVGSLMLARAARTAGYRVAALAATGGAAAIGLLAAAPSMGPMMKSSGPALPLGAYLGVAVAVFAIGWTEAIVEKGVAGASIGLFSAPLLVMALTAFESTLRVYGPSPVNWPPALAGVAAMLAGCVALWFSARGSDETVTSTTVAGPAMRTARWLGYATIVAGTVSLAMPALTATAEGGTSAPFSATWTMIGAESAAGWLVFAAAGLALAAVISARTDSRVQAWLPASVAALACDVAAFPLLGTTLHTWNRWVPADVQQTYGTEYSRLVIEPRLDSVRIAAMVLTVVTLVVFAVATRGPANIAGSVEEVS